MDGEAPSRLPCVSIVWNMDMNCSDDCINNDDYDDNWARPRINGLWFFASPGECCATFFDGLVDCCVRGRDNCPPSMDRQRARRHPMTTLMPQGRGTPTSGRGRIASMTMMSQRNRTISSHAPCGTCYMPGVRFSGARFILEFLLASREQRHGYHDV